MCLEMTSWQGIPVLLPVRGVERYCWYSLRHAGPIRDATCTYRHRTSEPTLRAAQWSRQQFASDSSWSVTSRPAGRLQTNGLSRISWRHGESGGGLLELVTAVMTNAAPAPWSEGRARQWTHAGLSWAVFVSAPACTEQGGLGSDNFLRYLPAFAKYKLPCSGSEIRGLLPPWWCRRPR